MTEEKQPVKWRHSRWGVLILLGIIGPLALPFLWKSPFFGKWVKWLLTIFTLVLTGIAILTAELLPLWISQTLIKF